MSDDLISRKAAIAKFEPWLKVDGYSEGELNMLKAVLYELTVMPSAEPEQQWIPCSKWLPKEGESAILRYSNGKISGGTYIGNRTWDVDFGDSDRTVSVTAWMPLQEPYKEGGTDD